VHNASGQCNWWLDVSYHCLLDVRFRSVILCWLMASWMNVANAVVARCFFFFLRLPSDARARSSPHLDVWLNTSRVAWIAVLGMLGLSCRQHPQLLRIGEGNRLHVAGAPTSPPSVVWVQINLLGCPPKLCLR